MFRSHFEQVAHYYFNLVVSEFLPKLKDIGTFDPAAETLM